MPAFFRLEKRGEPASFPVLSTAREWRQRDGHPLIGAAAKGSWAYPEWNPGVGQMSRKWFNRTA